MGVPLLLLTTVGRKSGKKWTRPVGYCREADNCPPVMSERFLAITCHRAGAHAQRKHDSGRPAQDLFRIREFLEADIWPVHIATATTRLRVTMGPGSIER
jgi:hypothetical protein